MHALPPQRGIGSTAVLSAGLVALIVLTTALAFLVFRPTSRAKFTVAPLEATTCPGGTHAPVCYKTSVKNTGSLAAQVQCVLTPGPGSQAMFLTDLGTYISPNKVPPADGLVMVIKVDAPDGGTVTSPTIACSSV